MKTSTGSALAVCASVLLSSSAMALGVHDEGKIAKETVRFKDLDISTAAGANALYERIKTAARNVCSDQEYMVVHKCQARAVAEAVAGVNSPLLSSIHRTTFVHAEEVARR